MDNLYTTIKVNGRVHVLTECPRSGTRTPQANYEGTGLALVAVLGKRESLKSFINKRLPKIKEDAARRAELAFKGRD